MPTRTAKTTWTGGLQDGTGTLELVSSGAGTYQVSFPKRAAEDADGTTSPEELIAAAHAACFNMAFSNGLAKAGHKVEQLNTNAAVEFVPGTGITRVTLTVRGKVGGIDDVEFQKQAAAAKEGCPVSKALSGNVDLRLEAHLER